MWIVKHRTFFYILSLLIIATAAIGLIKYGLNVGIDFKGGADLQVQWVAIDNSDVTASSTDNVESKTTAVVMLPAISEVREVVDPLNFEAQVRAVGNNGYDIKTRELNDEERNSLELAIKNLQPSGFEVVQFSSLGPVLGQETLRKSVWSIIFVMVCIVLFIAYAFRQVSRQISSWKYAMVTLLTLAHDLIVPLGVYAFLGHFWGAEADTLFVAAILTVLGFSVHDTIVVFDRIRERLRRDHSADFEEIVGLSVSDTLARSFNTSLTTLFALFALFFIGGEAVRWFTMTLIIGVIAGTYSSVFLGSPFLVTLYKWQKKK